MCVILVSDLWFLPTDRVSTCWWSFVTHRRPVSFSLTKGRLIVHRKQKNCTSLYSCSGILRTKCFAELAVSFCMNGPECVFHAHKISKLFLCHRLGGSWYCSYLCEAAFFFRIFWPQGNIQKVNQCTSQFTALLAAGALGFHEMTQSSLTSAGSCSHVTE